MTSRLSILWHYLQARRNFRRWPSREALVRWQESQIQRHLDCVRNHSPYYAKRFAGLPLEDWRNFPLQNKALLMADFGRWNTAGVSYEEAWSTAETAERSRDFSPTIRGLTVGLSSGTSGSRGIFLASAAERNRWVGVLLARCLRSTLSQSHRAALFLRADSTLYQNVGARRFSFTFFDLLQPMATHADKLRALQPTMLAAPPAALLALARLRDTAAFMAPPKVLLSVADVLTDEERNEIEHGFGCPVGQLYQATEGFLAATCPHGTLHWNEDAIVVQKAWLDDARTHYQPIITDFRRTTQPIVRYQLDDVIVDRVEPCPCGSVFGTLGSIAGRKDDVLVLAVEGDVRRPAPHDPPHTIHGAGLVTSPSAGGTVQVFPDFVRRAILLGVPHGVEFRVRQETLESWEIALSNLSHTAAVEREVALLCQTLNARMPKLLFVPWQPVPLMQKQRRVQCLVKP